MADIFDVADTIEKMANGFEEAVMECLEANSDRAIDAVRDQLMSGLRGDDSVLSPSYDNDPYFDDPKNKRWYQKNESYKRWKYKITPPIRGDLIDTPERGYSTPNLYINGARFHDLIRAKRDGDIFSIDAKGDEAENIKKKWGDDTLRLGSLATEYFSHKIIEPWIWKFFEQCGW